MAQGQDGWHLPSEIWMQLDGDDFSKPPQKKNLMGDVIMGPKH